MITSAAMKNGFTGGLIVDFPNSKKAKKYFLFLMAGYSAEIIKEAEEAVYKSSARRQDGEDYDFASSSDEEEDSEMDEDGDEEEKNEEDDSDEESDDEAGDSRYKKKDD